MKQSYPNAMLIDLVPRPHRATTTPTWYYMWYSHTMMLVNHGNAWSIHIFFVGHVEVLRHLGHNVTVLFISEVFWKYMFNFNWFLWERKLWNIISIYKVALSSDSTCFNCIWWSQINYSTIPFKHISTII